MVQKENLNPPAFASVTDSQNDCFFFSEVFSWALSSSRLISPGKAASMAFLNFSYRLTLSLVPETSSLALGFPRKFRTFNKFLLQNWPLTTAISEITKLYLCDLCGLSCTFFSNQNNPKANKLNSQNEIFSTQDSTSTQHQLVAWKFNIWWLANLTIENYLNE